MDIGLALLAILFAAIFGALCAGVFYASRDNDSGAAGALAVVSVIVLIAVGSFTVAGVDTEKGKCVETKTAPTVDTLIVTRNGVSDSTYYYKFSEKRMVAEP